MPIKFLPHTADIKFQASGATIEKAFEESAKALKQTITKLKIQDKQERKISIKGKDSEALLYNFLEEFLFLLDAEDFIISRIKEIKITLSEKKKSHNAIKDSTRVGEQIALDKKGIESKGDLGKRVGTLKATISGDRASNYKISNDVKAVTYNQMFVKKQGGKFTCQVVLDV